MRNYWLLLFTLFGSSFIHGQSTLNQLQILDAHTGQSIAGVHLKLLVDEDTLFDVSDQLGKVYWPQGIVVTQLWAYHVSFEDYRTNNVKNGSIHLMIPKRESLEEVVVSGQQNHVLSTKSIRQVRVIDQKRIQQQAAVNLADLLRQDLNFQITEDAVLGTQISLQGMSGSKIKVLIDGVPVIGRLDGNIDLSQINLNDIERVEIIEGPMAVQYGTDAVAGTINLITKKAQHSKFQAEVNSYLEAIGRQNFDGSAQWAASPNSQLSFSFGRNNFQGYDPNPDARNLQWNPKEQWFGSAQFKQRYRKNVFRLRSDFFDETIINLGAVGSMDSLIVPIDTGAWQIPRALDDQYRTRRWNNSVFWHGNTSKFDWRGFVSYNFFQRNKNTEIRNLSTGESSLFPGTDAQSEDVFHLFASRVSIGGSAFSEKAKWQVGYDVNWETNAGRRIAEGEQEMVDLALFGSMEYSILPGFELKPGLRYAYNSRFEAPLISSLALRWELNEKWIARGSYGRGFRAPSLKEMYFMFVDENHNILGNRDLKAETSNNFQAGIHYLKQGDFSWAVDAMFFFNDLRNEIQLVSVVEPNGDSPQGLFRNENIARSQNAGVNLSSRFDYKKWNAELGFAYLGMKNQWAFSSPSNFDFNFYPQFRFKLAYDYTSLGIEPVVFMNYTGRRQDLSLNAAGDLQTTEFMDFAFLDFNLRKSLFKKAMRISIGIQNILDVTSLQASSQITGGAHSAGSSSIPLSYGRTYFIKWQWSFD